MSPLHKAIQYALDNSWDMFGWKPALVSWNIRKSDGALRVKTRVGTKPPSIMTLVYSEETVIFNHDFAKALAGGAVVCAKCGTLTEFFREHPVTCACGEQGQVIEAFDHFLTSIALSPNREKYLESFMEEANNA